VKDEDEDVEMTTINHHDDDILAQSDEEVELENAQDA
jgi:hypothetical protein